MKIVFAGTPAFAAAHLAALVDAGRDIAAVFSQPDRRAGRGRRVSPSPVKRYALEHGLEVRQPESLRDKSVQAGLAAFGADLMVVVAFGLILPKDVLLTPRRGCINVHASLLPRWRGAAPIQRAVLAGDDETGVCVMQMEEGLDTGPVLHQLRCPIRATETAGELHDRLALLGARALVDALERMEKGELSAVPQDNSKATYAEKLRKSEAAMDWRRPAVLLDRQVRAFNPWPVAYTPFESDNLRVWEATPLSSEVSAEPGTVVAAGHDGIDLATGDGTLRLLRVQLPGGRAITAAEFLNSHPRLVGRSLLSPKESSQTHP